MVVAERKIFVTAVSHFRLLKVQQTGPAALIRSTLAHRLDEGIGPEHFRNSDSSFNFGSYGFEVHPTSAAISGFRLISRRAAEPNAWTGAIIESSNSLDEGGMALWKHQ
jgi:hypothetical protein